VFNAYLADLVDTGWTGSQGQVRLTYLTRIACEAIRESNLVSESIKREDRPKYWREAFIDR
jgi:hypothetical protein